MKAALVTQKLIKGIQLATRIIQAKSNLPILSNLLVTATAENYLQVESSNLELSIRLRIPAQVEEVGQFTVPGRKFTEYLSMIKEEKLLLMLDKTSLVVKGDHNQTSFVTMPADDFPNLPTQDTMRSQLVIGKNILHQIAKKTTFATSPRADQPVLTGVLLDFRNENQVVAVASDSFRLSLVKLPIAHALSQLLIVPAGTLVEIDRLLGEVTEDGGEGEVKLAISQGENQVFFQINNIEVISRLIEAEYPDYNKLVPGEFSTGVSFDRETLLDSIKTTAIFSSREGQLIRMKLVPAEQRAFLTAQSAEVGAHRGEIPAEIEGSEMELGFNSRYMVDALNSFDQEKVSFLVTTPRAPVLICHSAQSGLLSQAPRESDYQHIVMPMDLEGI